MSNNWYFANGREKVGPFSFDQLRQLVAAGTLSPNDLVWEQGHTLGIAVRLVPGLASDSQPSSVRPAVQPPTVPANTRKVVPVLEPAEPAGKANIVWFLKSGNSPTTLSWHELRHLAKEGKISTESLIRKEGWNNWSTAGSARGLFPEPFWIPGRLDRKALKGAGIGAAVGALIGGLIGVASDDFSAAVVGALVFGFFGAILGVIMAFFVWACAGTAPSELLLEDQPEPKPEPKSGWAMVGSVVVTIIVVVLFAAKAVSPALREHNQQQQLQPATQPNQFKSRGDAWPNR